MEDLCFRTQFYCLWDDHCTCIKETVMDKRKDTSYLNMTCLRLHFLPFPELKPDTILSAKSRGHCWAYSKSIYAFCYSCELVREEGLGRLLFLVRVLIAKQEGRRDWERGCVSPFFSLCFWTCCCKRWFRKAGLTGYLSEAFRKVFTWLFLP